MYSPLIKFFAAACSVSHSFFGLEPWYKYLKTVTQTDANGNQYCNIPNFNLLPGPSGPSDIPLVLIAIIDDLLRIAGLIAVVFVLYGAIQFVASEGNSESASKARSTIINALIGLAISIVAIAAIGFLGNQLKG